MYKFITTLVRGRSADMAQAAMDANALSILRQQLRDSAVGVEKSRKALAIIMAYADREKASLTKLNAQIGDLEARALDALSQDKEALAIEASEAIAGLESEAAATQSTIDTYAIEISRMRTILKESEGQLTELKRGQRLAEASDKTLKMRGSMPSVDSSDLADASATLNRLKERQEHADASATALMELSTESNATSISDRLAAAGCGTPKQSSANAVLERLKNAKKA